jgi:uncharacterized membrane protein
MREWTDRDGAIVGWARLASPRQQEGILDSMAAEHHASVIVRAPTEEVYAMWTHFVSQCRLLRHSQD